MELIGSKEIRSLLLSEGCYLPEKWQDHSKIAVSCSTPKANSRLLTHMVKKLAAVWKRVSPQHTCVSKEDNPQGGQPERRTKDLSQALDSEMPYSLVNSAVPTLSVLLALNSLCSYTLCSQHLHWKNSGHNCAPVCLWASRPWEAVSRNEQILFVLRCWKPTAKKWWHLPCFFGDKAVPPILLIESSHLSWVDQFRFRGTGHFLKEGGGKMLFGRSSTCVHMCVCVYVW